MSSVTTLAESVTRMNFVVCSCGRFYVVDKDGIQETKPIGAT